MEESEGNNDLEVKGFTLIDVSSENDSLITAVAASSSSTLTDHQYSETQVEPRRFELTGDLGAFTNGQSEQSPQLLETSEPERSRKTGKCNLRKSLAWDSAFFESPGVLDAEELSSMIEGAEKGKRHLLPGIEEDVCRSTESISTLESENLTLESLEAELFEDIRASIQKSSKASNMTNSNHKAASGETGNRVNCSAKKVDLTSQNTLNTNPASKKQTIAMQGSRRVTKQGSCYPQVTQTALRTGNPTSTLSRPPKVISGAEPISTITTKRASLSANRVKTEIDNAKVGGKGIQVPKATGLAGPRRTVPKPALSSKSSSSATFGATKKERTKSSSSSDSSCSPLSNNIGKSPLISARRKIESRPVIRPSSGSIPKALSKVPLRKNSYDNSNLSADLMSSKISSSISPASSISEWSSASSSTSTVKQRSKSRASLDINSSCRSLDSDTPPALCLDVQSNDHISDGNVNQVTRLPSQDTQRASMQTGILSRPASMKPSGLRMPSPKIGFFDGAKSVVRTPNGGMQSRSLLPTGLTKVGAGICSPVGSSNQARDGKLPLGITITASADATLNTLKSGSPKPLRASKKISGSLRVVKSPSISSAVQDETSGISCCSQVGSSNKAIGKLPPGMTVVIRSTNTKADSQKSVSPKPFQEPLSASVEASNVSRAAKSPSIYLEVHNEIGGVSCLKVENVGTGVPDREAEKNENLGDLKSNINLLMQGNADFEEIKIAPTNGDIFYSSTDNCIEYLKPSQGVGEVETYGENHGNDSLLSTINVKQIGHPGDQVDGLSRNIGAADSQVEMQEELTDNINSRSEVSDPDCGGALELESKKHFLPDQKEVSVNDLLPSSIRTPFAVKDSLCNIEGFDFSTGSKAEMVEKTSTLHSSEIVQIENI